ncbi:IS3 family transposase [Lysinibacillus xylanilyticus]
MQNGVPTYITYYNTKRIKARLKGMSPI